jgi:putative flippase GtrA
MLRCIRMRFLSRFGIEAKVQAYLLVGLFAVIVAVHAASHFFFDSLSKNNPVAPDYPIVVADSSYYARTAENIRLHHVFADSFPELTPVYATVPGYPFLMAVTKSLTGSFTPLVVVQEIIFLVALVHLFAITRRYVPFGWALVPVALFGLQPMVVYTTTTLLTDSLFASLLIIALYHGFWNERLQPTTRALILGVMLGMLSLLRPTGLLLAPLGIAFLAIQTFFSARERALRTAATIGAIAAIGASLFIGSWYVRNYVVVDTFAFIRSAPHAFLDYNVRYFLAWKELTKSGEASVYYPARHLNNPSIAAADAMIKAAWSAKTPPGEDPERYVGAVAYDFIAHDPIRYAYFHLAHLPVYMLSSSIGSYKQAIEHVGARQEGGRSTMYETIAAIKDLKNPERALTALIRVAPILLEVVFWLGVSCFALLGLFFGRRDVFLWLSAALITYFGVIAGAVTVARYRISAEPFLLLLAAYGAYVVFSHLIAVYRAGKDAPMIVPGWSRVLELIRYVIAGVSALATSVALYSLLVFAFDVHFISASIVGFIAAFFVSFVLQKFFAFKDQAGPGKGQQIGQYVLLLLFNITINTLLLEFFVDYIGMSRFLGLLYANIFVAIWNYIIYDTIIFTERTYVPPRYQGTNESLANLSVVIPCLNEAASIGTVIDSIPKEVGEVIVVDNNSTDATAAIARARGVRVIHESVPGTGSAMRAGFRAATKELVAVIDGDNQHPAGELARIVEQLRAEKLDFISAARFPLSDSWVRGFGNWGLTLMTNILFHISLTDSQSGMVVFKRNLFSQIEPQSNDFVFVQELKIRAARSVRFVECRIPCRAREMGTSKLLPVRHGIQLLYALFVLRRSGLLSHSNKEIK